MQEGDRGHEENTEAETEPEPDLKESEDEKNEQQEDGEVKTEEQEQQHSDDDNSNDAGGDGEDEGAEYPEGSSLGFGDSDGEKSLDLPQSPRPLSQETRNLTASELLLNKLVSTTDVFTCFEQSEACVNPPPVLPSCFQHV